MLSKKNKDMGKIVLALIGAVVLVFAIIRGKKSADATKQPLAASVGNEIKKLVTA